jgi:hypothetical protein
LVKKDVGIARTATEGRFLSKGHEIARASGGLFPQPGAALPPIILARVLLCVARGVGVNRSYCGLVHHLFPFLRRLCWRISLSILARVENRSDDPSCIHRLLSRTSLFFWLRARFRLAHDHTPYHQQALGTSFLPWS